MNAVSVVQKIWSYCDVLRDVGVSYGDYLEQLTYLLFLKMADEYAKPPHKREIGIPREYTFTELKQLRGAALETHYINLLRDLGKQKGMLGQVFTKSQNKIQDPAMLSRIIDMIDKEQWTVMGSDIKGEIYEGLLAKNAEDIKSGAGQYFTPRPVIQAIVECVRPETKKTIADPACGTGGFFLGAYEFLSNHNKLNKAEKTFLKFNTFSGNEIVANTRRIALMNMILHGIGDIDAEPSIELTDSLIVPPKKFYDYVFTNPPFGKKSSITITNGKGKAEKEEFTYNRQDFWVTTSNKQLNFVQHVRSMLKTTGKAAIVVPDNVLFEGGAGEIVRHKLMETTDLHTVLRLPTGIFYAHGVKANVLFFDNRPAAKKPQTKEVWFYDYRTNVHHTLKKKPIRFEDLQEFIACYSPKKRHKRKETWCPEKNPGGRWRVFSYKEIIARDKASLDILWLKDTNLTDLDNLPDPEVLAEEIVETIEAVLSSFREVASELNGDSNGFLS